MERLRIVKALGGKELRELFVGNKREIASLRKNLKKRTDFTERLFTAHRGNRILAEAKVEENLGLVIEKEDKLYKNTFKVLDAQECSEFCWRLTYDHWTVTRLSGGEKNPPKRRWKK